MKPQEVRYNKNVRIMVIVLLIILAAWLMYSLY